MTSNCLRKTKHMMLRYKWWMCYERVSFKRHGIQTICLLIYLFKRTHFWPTECAHYRQYFPNRWSQTDTTVQIFTFASHIQHFFCQVIWLHGITAQLTPSQTANVSCICVFLQLKLKRTWLHLWKGVLKEIAQLEDLQSGCWQDTRQAKQKTLSTLSSPLSHDIMLSKRTFAPLMCLWGASRWPLICSHNSRLLENLLWPETHTNVPLSHLATDVLKSCANLRFGNRSWCQTMAKMGVYRELRSDKMM